MAVKQVGVHTFAIAGGLVDHLVTVTENELAAAIRTIAERTKTIVEGAGAAAWAACLSGKVPFLQNKRVVVVCSGGNIDLSVLGELLTAQAETQAAQVVK